MTVNDTHHGATEKHLENHQSGDHQVAGKPITDKADNAAQQRLEHQTAAKAFRFTKDGGNAFSIDMGDGKAAVNDKRPLRQEEEGPGLVPARIYPDGHVEVLGKDGKFHKDGTIPPSQMESQENVEQDKNGNYHKIVKKQPQPSQHNQGGG